MTWEFLLVGLIGQGFRGYYSGKGKSGGGSIVGGFVPAGKAEAFDKMKQEANSGDPKKGDLVERIYDRLDDERLAASGKTKSGASKFNLDGKTATEAGFRSFKVQEENQWEKKELQTAAGTRVSVSVIGGEVDFKINGRTGVVAGSEVVDPISAGKLALSTAKKMSAGLPNGTLIFYVPYDADSRASARNRVYQKLGFGKKMDESQYSIVHEGKAYPVDRKFYKKYIKPAMDAGNFP